jgi:hypothetical protein
MFDKDGVLRPHTEEICGDHLDTLYAGCNLESARVQFAQVRPAVGCGVRCARDCPGGAHRKCVILREERVAFLGQPLTVAGGFGEI